MVRNKLMEVPPLVFVDLFLYIYIPPCIQGEVAEWLGRGLQNLLQRFESALRLNNKARKRGLLLLYPHALAMKSATCLVSTSSRPCSLICRLHFPFPSRIEPGSANDAP